MQHGGHALQSLFVARDEEDEGVREGEQEKRAVEEVVRSFEVSVLLLVEHHEAVVLFDQMVIGPQRREEEEDEARAEEYGQRPDGEEEERPPEQTAPRATLLAVEVCAREG